MEKKLFVNTSRPPPQQQAPLLTSLGSSPSNSNSNSMEYHNQQQQQVGMGLGLGDLNCFLNLNWDNSMMGVDDSALSSMVSSPLAPPCNSTNSLVIRELIGRLGSICNSGGDPQFNSNSTMLDLDHNSSHQNPSLDPGFYERAARYSQFNNIPTTRLDSGKISRVSSTQSLKAAAAAVSDRKLLSRSCTPDNAEFDDSSASASASASEPNTNNNTSRKRKAVAKPKSKDLLLPSSATISTKDSKQATTKNDDDDDISNIKRCKATETDKEKVVEPPKDYIHVRARRGQATDSHSLAERVRREKISERMKFLQDLVPGCNKVTGKAVMLDEIINYVQSLQRQVEFLSMKLATVNPRMEVNMETLFSKDILQSHGSSPHAIHPTDSSASAFHYGHQPLQSGITNVTETHCSVNNPLEATQRLNLSMQLPPLDGFGDGDSQLATFWEDDLQSIVQMGFGQNQNLHGGTLPTSHMKVEL